MTLMVVLALNAAILFLIALVFKNRLKAMTQEFHSSQGFRRGNEDKNASLKAELASLKEDNVRKTKQLEELREISKRRLKKEALNKPQEEVSMMAQTESAPSFDLALKTVQHQAEQSYQEEVQKVKAHYQERIAKLEAQLGQRKQNIDKSKKNLEAHTQINLEGLPEDTVLEVGRLLKKSDHAEKLLAATRGKLQMAQERFSEMQKRYFGVCRELALASGQNLELNDEQIRNQAEDMLVAAEQPGEQV